MRANADSKKNAKLSRNGNTWTNVEVDRNWMYAFYAELAW